MSRMLGTVSMGIRAPIIRQGDDLVKIVTDCVMQAVENETLADLNVEWHDGAAACIILASGGYPESYRKGFEIDIPGDVFARTYVAGAVEQEGKLLTSGGRVLGITNIADTLEQAIALSYKDVEKVSFEGAVYRKDIGAKALKARR